MELLSIRNIPFSQVDNVVDWSHDAKFDDFVGCEFPEQIYQQSADGSLSENVMIPTDRDRVTYTSTIPMAISQQHGTNPFSRPPPTSKDWEKHRQTITKLYKVEKRSLKDVKSFMETKYDFRATDKMYKKRISDWNIRRNLRWSERDEICRVVKQRELAGKMQHTVIVRGQLLSTNRISQQLRKMTQRETVLQTGCSKQHQEDADLVICSPVSSPEALQKNSLRAVARPTSPQILSRAFAGIADIRYPIYPPGDEKAIEIICAQISYLFEEVPSMMEIYDAKIIKLLYNADFFARDLKYQECRIMLNRAGEELRKDLERGDRETLHSMCSTILDAMTFVSCSVNPKFNVTRIFCQHAVDLSLTILGPFHPLSIMLVQMKNIDNLFQAHSSKSKACIATLEKDGPLTQSRVTFVLELKIQLNINMRRLGLIEEAEEELRQARDICKNYKVDELLCTRVLHQFARLKLKAGDDDGAATMFWEMVGSELSEGDHTWKDSRSYDCYRGLADIAERHERWEEAAEYYQETSEAAARLWGADHYEVFYFVHKRADVLERQGKLFEAQALREQYVLADDDEAQS